MMAPPPSRALLRPSRPAAAGVSGGAGVTATGERPGARAAGAGARADPLCATTSSGFDAGDPDRDHGNAPVARERAQIPTFTYFLLERCGPIALG
jgi:hypothetical protein